MKRKQHFEIIDLPQTPEFIRDAITNFLYLIQKILMFKKIITPRMIEVFKKTGQTEIYDLCSGGGGAMPMVLDDLRKNYSSDIRLCMTDLFPNLKAAEHFNAIENIRYLVDSVDATNVPESFQGVRTMLLGFHHMPEYLAQGILEDAFNKRQPIAIFEITNNTLPAWLGMIFLPIAAFLLMPFTKPDWKQLLFTYVIPVIPLVFWWDGTVSCLRTYSKAEMAAMTKHLAAADYQWDIGYVWHPMLPYRVPYLVGCPA